MTDQDIIQCFPTYSQNKLRVGDMIMAQHICAKYKILPMQAKALLDNMVKKGYLTYDKGADSHIAGWHLTEEGLLLVM